MFVKVIVKTKEGKAETRALHECASVLMMKALMKETGEDVVVWDLHSRLRPSQGEDLFTLQFNKGDEVFIMNNEGVTVDRYWF